MSDGLRPCPFCGGEAEKSYQPAEEGSYCSSYDVIRCIDCGSQTRPKHWNNRPQLDEAVECLKEVLGWIKPDFDKKESWCGDRKRNWEILQCDRSDLLEPIEETLSNLRGDE